MEAFTRQLGGESGVQLNALRDNSEIPAFDIADQVFGIAMRATRGRIDQPFKINRGNVFKKLGKGEAIRTSALNEAWIQVVEALNNGAYEAVVQRLVTGAAVVKWAVSTQEPLLDSNSDPILDNHGHAIYTGGFSTSHTPAVLTATVAGGVITGVTVNHGGTDYAGTEQITVGGPGTGAVLTPVFTNGVITSVTITHGGTGYTTAPTLTVLPTRATPVDLGLIALKHLECHNDGIRFEYRADEKKVGGVLQPNDRITLRIRDKDNVLLYEFFGSLDPAATDDFGKSLYLPDVIAGQTDAVEAVIGATTTIPPGSDAYGYDANGQEKWAKSGVLVCFTEGGTGYTTADYVAACDKLRYTIHNYAYLASGGTQSSGLLAQLALLAFATNRQLRVDVPGHLTPEAAIAWVEALNLGASPGAHLVHYFWAPLKSDDPAGLNGKGYFGTATLNIAYACRRNAQTNSKGFAPKNYPIAGREWPILRTGLVQTYTPRDQELNALANAKINPVLYETYSGGGRYVFRDSLTAALVENSLKKLISVADMSTSVDEIVTRFAKDVLQLPMDVAVKRMSDFLTTFFTDAQASGWLVPSSDPAMDRAAWRFEVKPNEQRPYDRMDVAYWLRYDGTNRQVFVTQTLSK